MQTLRPARLGTAAKEDETWAILPQETSFGWPLCDERGILATATRRGVCDTLGA